MAQDKASPRCPFASLAQQVERQANRPLAPRRRELRLLALRLRTAAVERPADRPAA